MISRFRRVSIIFWYREVCSGERVSHSRPMNHKTSKIHSLLTSTWSRIRGSFSRIVLLRCFSSLLSGFYSSASSIYKDLGDAGVGIGGFGVRWICGDKGGGGWRFS